MVLDERKLKAIESIIKGENITDTAKLSGVNRKSIYRWMEEDEFKAELARRTQVLKTAGEQRLGAKLGTYIDEMERIALTGRSEKNRADCLKYLIDRNLGTPTSKVEDVTTEEEHQNKVDNSTLENEFEKFRLKKLK